MKFSTASAATAAFFTSASAVSTFAVVNRCAFDLFVWHVEGGSAPSKMFTLPANSPHIGYSETFRYVSQYAGVSLKVAPYYVGNGELPPPSVNITQLEYTVPPPQNNDPNIYYDLSMVNGNSLMGIPFTYSPSNPGAVPQCAAGSCSGSYSTCEAGYNGPKDDWNTHACPKSQDVIFTFCNGNAQQPLIVPTGQVDPEQFSKLTCINGGSCMKKREVEAEAAPEPEVEADADPMAVCYSAAAANAGDGVPILAGLCENAATTSSSSAAPAPAPTHTSTSSAASAPSAVAALQQPAKPPTTTSSSSAAPVATQAPAAAPAPAPAPAPAAPAGPPVTPLSQLQLSSLANTGVTCWLSIGSSETCGVSSRSLPEKRSVQAHSHRHNHQAFHRRNRIIKSAA